MPVLLPSSVRPGATPWSLAEHHLGDGLRWREIWEINRGRPPPDGRAWSLQLQFVTGWQLSGPFFMRNN